MNTVERIKSICKERKIAISTLEKECGFGNAYISQLRKGTVPDDRLRKIAKFLNLSTDYLMTGTENKYNESSASIVAKIRNDVELTKALEKYFRLSDEKKKHVIDTINMIGEE